MKNYYQILGVEYTATDDDIKKAYRKRAVKYHPDKNPGDKDKEEIFIDVTEAYEVLKDKDKRKKYDILIGVHLFKKDNVELKSNVDIENEQMRNGKPSVVIDPNGEVYVDISKMGKDMGINIDYFSSFFR